jgi:hypothetical protein
MLDRAGGTAGGKCSAGRQIVFQPVRVRRDLDAHQRHANKIGDLFLFDQLHRMFCIPFGHHDQLTADDEALQYNTGTAAVTWNSGTLSKVAGCSVGASPVDANISKNTNVCPT